MSYLKVTIGQATDKGRKTTNQDFHGSIVPDEPQLTLKGVAAAMADGISTSGVSDIASETAVKSFLEDYFCTSDAWSVKNSVHRVLTATNAWLHSQSRKQFYEYEREQGYICTLSALVIKAATAHLFHAGDTRIYRLRDNGLEQLTKDHRLWLSREESYLSRAFGVDSLVELDYQALPVKAGDIFILATDGVYEHADARTILKTITDHSADLDRAARCIIDQALEQGSEDNLSIQLIRVDAVPQGEANDLHRQIEELPLPPVLEARSRFDGYEILREIHATSRSHVYLARDEDSDAEVILKIPSVDLREDPAYLERFLMEEWIARRVNSAHVMKAAMQSRERSYLYTVTEYIRGQTLAQWLNDNRAPDLETVRGIVEQIARGLYALHRKEILHQDLKPDNVMIDENGTVKLIDLGNARVAGIVEANAEEETESFPGTALYMAPEYFIGEAVSTRSDLYSLGVLTYHMLSGRFPYGIQVAKARTVSAQRKLQYRSVLHNERAIPAWIDHTLKTAVHPNPDKRYQELSEFMFDLRHPNQAFLAKTRPPLIERNPVAVWQGISAILALIIVYLLFR